MKAVVRVVCLVAATTLTACANYRAPDGSAVAAPNTKGIIPQVDTTQLLPATIPYAGTLIPSTLINLSPSISFSLEKLVFWGVYAGTAWLITDPLAPNWDIEATPFDDDYVHFSLHMKRYYAGGAGEARVIFHRKAKELTSKAPFNGYQVVEYSEGMESSLLGSQRTATGVIRVSRRLD